MTLEQHVHHCDEHEDCTVIVGVQDGVEVWRSHMHSAIHAEHRLNMDFPDATDHRGDEPVGLRWTPLCDDCLGHSASPWKTEEDRQALHAVARQCGLMP